MHRLKLNYQLKRCVTQDGGKGRLSSTLRRASVMLPGTAQQDFRVGFAEGGAASPGAAAREELLGGELVVKIEDATVCTQPSAAALRHQNLQASLYVPECQSHHTCVYLSLPTWQYALLLRHQSMPVLYTIA